MSARRATDPSGTPLQPQAGPSRGSEGSDSPQPPRVPDPMPSFIPSEARSLLYPQDALNAPRKNQEITPVPVSGGHTPASVHPLTLPLSHMPHAPAHPCPAPCGCLRSRNVPLTSTPDTCSQASLSRKEGRRSDQLDQGSERSRPHFCLRLGRNRAPRPLKWTRATRPEGSVLCTADPGRAKSGLSAEYSPCLHSMVGSPREASKCPAK